ncbi:hypothetical protein C8J56DRAFT_1052402 [Mycena floridula]|nr:hypothetical protein C8J56DRAFT_1052402 [Mycena floridula]
MLKIEEAQLIATFMLILFHGIYLVSFFPTMQILLWNGEATFGTRYLDYILRILIGSVQTVADWCLQSSCAFAAIFADLPVLGGLLPTIPHHYCILPTLLWAADTACAGVIIWIQRSSTASESLVNASRDLKSFYVAYSGLTIPLNIITTSTSSDRVNAKFCTFSDRQSTLQNIMKILIESGLMSTVTAIASFASCTLGSNAFYILNNMIIPITGIAMNLILIRVNCYSEDEYTIPSRNSSLHFPSRMMQDTVLNTSGPIVRETES